jgi:methyltransferase (TIGR00027 family)
MSGNISETAIIVASLRALSNYEDDPYFQCLDQYAELFLPDERRIPLQDAEKRHLIKMSIPKGMYEYVISRTRYFDHIFLEALKSDFGQIVFLGAGFDSRPYRFSKLVDGTRIFEVDASSTQEYKKSILTKNEIANNDVVYISTNFEEGDLFKRLKENGFNQSVRTLFLWEGVTFYLTEDAVNRMLCEIAFQSAAGSRICFDFQTMKSKEELIKTGLREEAIKFGISEGRIDEFVSLNRYTKIEHLDAKEIEKRFMTDTTGNSIGKIAPIMNFILIEHKNNYDRN